MSNGNGIRMPDVTDWKKHKVTISVGSIIFGLALLWGAHKFIASHAGKYFLPVAAAEELTQKVEEALMTSAENSAILTNFIRRTEIRDAREKVDSLRSELQATLLWESANGENEISRARKSDINREITRYENYVACIERNPTNFEIRCEL